MKINLKRLISYVVAFLIFLIAFFSLLPSMSYAQVGCPEFKLNIDETAKKVEVVLERGSSSYQISDFKIVQKNQGVEGPLNFEYGVNKEGSSIIFYNLKPSEELVLKEYAIKYYNKNCNDGKVIEIGRFKIK